jgi:hypothetical protein
MTEILLAGTYLSQDTVPGCNNHIRCRRALYKSMLKTKYSQTILNTPTN